MSFRPLRSRARAQNVANAPAANSAGNGRCVVLNLAPELLEEIVVNLAEAGSPVTIAAVARCCKYLHSLVCKPSDQSLWRRVFLTTFDDPRVTMPNDKSFDWAHAYRSRIHAQLVIKAKTAGNVRWPVTIPANRPPRPKIPTEEKEYTYTSVLQALLDVVDTSVPIYSPADTIERPAPARGQQTKLHLLPLAEIASRVPPYSPVIKSTEGHLSSKNIPWLRATLVRGLPQYLLWRFSDSRPTDAWTESEEGKTFRRLAACVGVDALLVGFTDEDHDGIVRGEGRRHRIRRSYEMYLILNESRRRVYNMAYPVPERAWGPFIPVDEDVENMCEGNGAEDIGDLSVIDVDADDIEGGDDTNEVIDVDAEPDHQHNGVQEVVTVDEDTVDHNETHCVGHDNVDIISVSSDSDSEVESSYDTRALMAHTPSSGSEDDPHDADYSLQPLEDSQLYPDWEYLAAVRVVVETHLRKFLSMNAELEKLWNMDLNMDLVRRAWREDSVIHTKGKRRQVDGEVEGWDWAGVEGVWQRAVCWLDYDNLIRQNREGFTRFSRFRETHIIVPLTLRIVKYTPCVVPGYEHRPKIHVDGWMGGAAWDGDADQRRIRGTVSVIADGSVRWSLLSSTVDPSEWEWNSEGVQIGSGDGVRSGCGVLGLWTGWTHHVEDPIGAWWQWRVA